jgi:tetratricopeptide (TPR) repeat protein
MHLGRAYQVANRLDDAIAIFSRVRKIRESSLGQDHPDTVAAASQLAYAYRTAGRLKEAISLYRQVVASRQVLLGPDHPDTLAAQSNLASSYHSAHRMKDAIPLYERLPTGSASRALIITTRSPRAATWRGHTTRRAAGRRAAGL